MTDNSRASLGTQDGDTFAFDDIAGIKFARSKLVIGADGTNDGDVSSANPLPITATSLPLPTLAATGGKQDTGNTSLASIDGKIIAVNTGAVVISSGTLTTVSTVTALTAITNALPAGTNVIGHVIVDSGSISATQSGAYNITNISGTVSLPTGAATDTLQTSGNSSLSAINNKLPSLGAAATTASVPVNIASDQTVPISNASFTTLAALSGTQGAAASAQTGVLGLGYASDNPTPAADGYLAALSLDTDRRLRVSTAPEPLNWFTAEPMTQQFDYISEIKYV